MSRSYMNLDFDMTYYDTNLGSSDCFGQEICDSTLVLTIGKSL